MATYRVDKGDAGKRLDVVVAALADISRAEAQKMIMNLDVAVEGSPAKASMKVSEGQELTVSFPEGLDILPESVPFDIRYEDPQLAIINKPAGVVVHPAPGTRETTLAQALAKRISLPKSGDPWRRGIVHRLDRDTSGLLVVAKTDDAYERLVAMMKRRMIRREYVAMVLGTFDKPSGRIEAPIGRAERDRTRMDVTELGRNAVTEFIVEESLGSFSLVRIRLITGRTHQIRVHFSHIGHPVMGDRSYGRKAEGLAREVGLDRPFLHATSISFDHPITGEPLIVSEDLPVELKNALERARRLQQTNS